MVQLIRWTLAFLAVVLLGLYGASRFVSPVAVPLAVPNLDEMVLVQGGTLPADVSGVPIDVAAFYLDRFEVTEANWETHRRLRGLDTWEQWSPDDRRGPDFPMRYVSLSEAESHAAALGKRLPTNQEWEWACRYRGGPFPWGHLFRENAANVSEIWQGGVAGVLRVGTFESGCSEAGVYDLVGNVWEWTGSDVGDLLHHSIQPGGDLSHLSLLEWTGERYGIIRGGAFSSRLRGRSAFEIVEHSANRSRDVGFRCALSADEVARQEELIPLIHDLGYRDPWNLWWRVRPARNALRDHGKSVLPLLSTALKRTSDSGLSSRLTQAIDAIKDDG